MGNFNKRVSMCMESCGDHLFEMFFHKQKLKTKIIRILFGLHFINRVYHIALLKYLRPKLQANDRR